MRNRVHPSYQAANGVAPQLRDKPAVRIIPYDYVASFKLTGRPGFLIEDVINIGVEGTFIGVAIGYGLAADTANPVALSATREVPPEEEPTPALAVLSKTLGEATLADIPPHVLLDGFRFNPALERVAFPKSASEFDDMLPVEQANTLGLFQRMRPVADFSFLFNIVDTGSGRELQNAPIHNIAGLGKSNGERPFRMLAKPLAFLPRSSVRIQVEEQSEGVEGTLFIVVHGYKILGAAGVAEEHLRVLYQKAMRHFGLRLASAQAIEQVETGVLPSRRLVPFDYVGTLALTGTPDNVVETEININVEGGFVATSIGYSLRVDDTDVKLILNRDDPDLFDATGNVRLENVKLSYFTSEDVKGGFRIRESLRRIAFNNGRLTALPESTAQALFEPLNLPDAVSFLYSIEDTGTGRAWQNEPVHNIAGLGIADGDRPFRNLAWPMHFLPRSTIRLRVEERFGRGRLYVVFQGYKKLGTP